MAGTRSRQENHTVRSGEKRRREGRGRFPAALLAAASPLLVVILIGVFTGTSPFHIDMWNTTWSDEVGYWRTVRLIRKFGTPQGWAGYNEVTSQFLPYSAYPVTTYLPYCFLSLFTGVEAKSYFLWCNLILAVAGILLWILLAEPDRKKLVWVAVFFFTNLVLGRYIWSGMAEASYIFYMMVMSGLSMRYASTARGNTGEDRRYGRDRKRRGGLRARELEKLARAGRRSRIFLIVVMVILTAFWSMIRPYFLVMFLLPIGLLVTGRDYHKVGKGIGTAVTVGIGAASYRVYAYLSSHYCARYFGGASSASRINTLLNSGSISRMVRRIFDMNHTAVQTLLDLARQYKWAGLVTALFALQWILLLAVWIRRLARREHDGSGMHGFVLLLLGALVCEATAVLYNPAQLHRMLLAIMVSYALYIIMYGHTGVWLNEAAVIAVMAVVVLHTSDVLSLPQEDEQSISGAERRELETQFETMMPLSEDPWDNTVAKNTNGEDYRTTFLLPVYVSLNVCREEKLDELITDSNLRSRYLFTLQDDDVNRLCESAQEEYTVLWEGYGHILYRRGGQQEGGNIQN